jgi:hypothetical protein
MKASDHLADCFNGVADPVCVQNMSSFVSVIRGLRTNMAKGRKHCPRSCHLADAGPVILIAHTTVNIRP